MEAGYAVIERGGSKQREHYEKGIAKGRKEISEKGRKEERKKKEGKAASRKDQGGGTRHELRANCPVDCSCSLLCAAVAAVCSARCFLDLEATSGRP